MVARLWWKDARQFWPIWVLLVVAAIITQMVLLHFLGDEIRTGGLGILAFGWACLYGFAVGAASLAGERETNTLILLDTMPVSRRVLWGAKASFAFATTLALAVLLLAISALSTTKWDGGLPLLVGHATIVLLAVLGWGFFWSSILENALAAAALAVCTVGVFPAMEILPSLDSRLVLGSPGQVGLAVSTILASAFLFIRTGPPRRPLFRPRPRSAPKLTAEELLAAAPERTQRLMPAWPRALWSLAWQTGRVVRRWWWRLALIGLVLPILVILWSRTSVIVDPALWLIFNLSIGITTGVLVFGTDNAARTQRFLAQHAVRPGLVWLVRIVIWFAAVAILWGLGLVWFEWQAIRLNNSGPLDALLIISGALSNSLAIGVLAGMVIRRGITAGLVAVLALFGVTAAEAGLQSVGVLPGWMIFAIPLLFLAISFGWVGEWMLDRPGARKWIKLACLSVGGAFALFAAYICERAYNVPSLEPEAASSITMPGKAANPVVPGENAALIYREALRTFRLKPAGVEQNVVQGVVDLGWTKPDELTSAWLNGQARMLESIRRGAALPACEFAPLGQMTVFSGKSGDLIPPLNYLGDLMTYSVRDRMARGDLDGAWDDIMVMFRIARQWSGSVPLAVRTTGEWTEGSALSMALAWAVDPRQTRVSLRRALDAFHALPAMPSLAKSLRAEATTVGNTLRLSATEIVEKTLNLSPKSQAREKAMLDVMTTPWEMARARRVIPLLLASNVAEAERKPWDNIVARSQSNSWIGFLTGSGPDARSVSAVELDDAFRTTPLSQWVVPNVVYHLILSNRNEVARRALEQVLALRSWQVAHGGRLPDQLAEIVPTELERLPDDPYHENNPFRYVGYTGQPLLPLGDLDTSPPLIRARPLKAEWLLYSVGPDLRDNGAQSSYMDIIFPIGSENPVTETR